MEISFGAGGDACLALGVQPVTASAGGTAAVAAAPAAVAAATAAANVAAAIARATGAAAGASFLHTPSASAASALAQVSAFGGTAVAASAITGQVCPADEEPRSAQDVCLAQCRELAIACAALRAGHKAKAARRGRELHDAQSSVDQMREELTRLEDSCEAGELVADYRREVAALQLNVERLHAKNATLAGITCSEQKRNAQRATLQSLQMESKKLRQRLAGASQVQKRTILVRRCLDEVTMRLDIAKRRFDDADRECAELQPCYGDLARNIEESEARRAAMQQELDGLRRNSEELRAEISHLDQVRSVFNVLPPPDTPWDGTPAPSSGGLEQFALLQRRLITAAPQLMPLCTRARAEMEELGESCQRLEKRRHRLREMMAFEGELSCASSVCSSNAAGHRPRSADATSQRERGCGRSAGKSRAQAGASGCAPAGALGSQASLGTQSTLGTQGGGQPNAVRSRYAHAHPEVLDAAAASGAAASPRHTSPRLGATSFDVPVSCRETASLSSAVSARGEARRFRPPSRDATPRPSRATSACATPARSRMQVRGQFQAQAPPPPARRAAAKSMARGEEGHHGRDARVSSCARARSPSQDPAADYSQRFSRLRSTDGDAPARAFAGQHR
eukprot:NODE_61_length_3942_cov_2.832765.p1 GENE.NODE_61_length_3942_cov_2.832765~~NODE_61_length_3942_cov_2.832765.p1  ORF type:complete len:625 (-),score=179.62 NODE_61_length_3942_cov_2.832765:560-2434(-)